MSETPAPRDPGQDDHPPGMPAGPGDYPSLGSPEWRLVPQSPDWPEWLAGDDAHADDEYPGDPDEYEDPDNAPPPGLDDAQLAALIAEAQEITAEQARAAEIWARLGRTGVVAAVGAVCAGRRGPGMPGSAESFPGEYAGPAAGAAVAGPAQMPEAVDEFAGRELGAVLGISAGDAEEMLDLSWQLAVNLPGTSAAFRAGILSRDKAAIMYIRLLPIPGAAQAAVQGRRDRGAAPPGMTAIRESMDSRQARGGGSA
jgi:hypothetical protein